MARARSQNDPTNRQHPAGDDGEQDEPFDVGAKEHVTIIGGGVASSLVDDDRSMKHLPDPRESPATVKGDATAKNRDPSINAITSARALGGESFKRLERQLIKARTAVLEAEEGSDVAALQKAYREAKREHDEAAEGYAMEAAKKAKVRKYRVVDNNQGKARNVSGTGSLGQARMPPGKEVDSLNYNIESLRKQGIKLEEILDENEPESA